MKKAIYILFLLSACVNETLEKVNHKANLLPYIPGKHDCRNYAEEKYQELIKNGYNSDKIRFVITEYNKGPHVVLKVGNLILDNNFYNPYPATKALQGGLTYKAWKAYRDTSI